MDEGRLWREALERLRRLDAGWPLPGAPEAARRAHAAALENCRAWMAALPLPRLARLAEQLAPGIDRRRLWCALVPVERENARIKITDVDILDADLDDAAAAAGPPAAPLPLTLVLDSIRSAFNTGGIFRTAECFGVRKILLCGYTPGPAHPAVARAALGTQNRVPWERIPEIRDAVRGLRARSIPCLALETVAGAPDIAETDWPFPSALLLGNERFGLPPDVLRLCDGIVRIPLYGRKNSLNVVSACAVALHAIRRRMPGKDYRL